MQGSACWPCTKTKLKCEPGSEKGRGEGNVAGTRKPAPTQKVKPSQSQPDQAKTKVGPSGKVPVPAAPKPRHRLVKSAVYVFSSDEESEVEAKVGPSRPALAQESKAGPSQLAPAKKKEGLFASEEESEPLARKAKGKGKEKEGKINIFSVFYI